LTIKRYAWSIKFKIALKQTSATLTNIPKTKKLKSLSMIPTTKSSNPKTNKTLLNTIKRTPKPFLTAKNSKLQMNKTIFPK
jgi:hypothetical protein